MLKKTILSTILTGVIMAENISISKENKELDLTIYNNNLAFVSELRTIQIPVGNSNLIYEGISAKVIPESVISNLNGDITLYSQSYSYNLFDFDSILKKSIGEEVEYQIDQKIRSGILLSQNPIMVKDNEKVFVLEKSSQIIFKKIPIDLKVEPSFNWKINSTKDTVKDISLKYLTNGLSWNSNYVASLEHNKLNLNGWITVNNDSGVTYNNANLTFLAGEVNQEKPQRIMAAYQKAAVLELADSTEVKEESFSGYHTYKIPFKETLKDKEKKQILFISKNNIPYKNYGYALISPNSNHTGEKEIKFNNMIEFSELDISLPAGIIRTYKKNSIGKDTFVGESRIQNTPKNEKIKMEIGKLFDITGRQKVVQFNSRVNGFDMVLEINLKNNGNEDRELVFDIAIDRHLALKRFSDNCELKNTGKCVSSSKNAWTREYELILKAGENYKFLAEYEVLN